jgi:hypothetical protein
MLCGRGLPKIELGHLSLLFSDLDKSMKRTLLLVATTIVATTTFAVTNPTSFPFDRSQLSGWWGESYNTDFTCGPQNLKTTMEVSPDGKRLKMRFDRKWKTELGETDQFASTIISATNRTLVIQYDGETRLKKSGKPVEWELAIVAPGVYRWRETEWKPGDVNTVVGIRCSQ